MTEAEAAKAVESWLNDVVEGLGGSYPFFPASLNAALPIGVVEIQRKVVQLGGDEERFPHSELQQAYLRVFDFEITLIVDLPTGDDDAGAKAAEALYGYGTALEESLIGDTTLGDRVQMTSPLAEAIYRLPFVEWPDGTRGRQMTFSSSVAEVIDYDS